MAISHLCLGCGFDLARVRTRPDPHYALPLVVCPDCGDAAVRRVHPLQLGWRAFLRVPASIIALVIQLGLLSGAAAAVIGVCVEGERWARGNLIATARQEMTQLRRPWLFVCAVAIVGLACVFLLVPIMDLHLETASWSRTAARQQLAVGAIGIGLVFCIAALVMGLWFGRPLSRLMVRGLLPPRLRASRALLWTAENLDHGPSASTASITASRISNSRK